MPATATGGAQNQDTPCHMLQRKMGAWLGSKCTQKQPCGIIPPLPAGVRQARLLTGPGISSGQCKTAPNSNRRIPHDQARGDLRAPQAHTSRAAAYLYPAALSARLVAETTTRGCQAWPSDPTDTPGVCTASSQRPHGTPVRTRPLWTRCQCTREKQAWRGFFGWYLQVFG